jgi:NADP-reducing hydrogenase subunit HndB
MEVQDMKTIQELEEIRNRVLDEVSMRKDRTGTRIVVGMATCGIAAGARPVLLSFVQEVKERNLNDVIISQTGCIGMCSLEPIVEVYKPGEEKVTYAKMTAEKAKEVIEQHIIGGKPITRYTVGAYEYEK